MPSRYSLLCATTFTCTVYRPFLLFVKIGGEVGYRIPPRGRTRQWPTRFVEKLQAQHLLPDIPEREGTSDCVFACRVAFSYLIVRRACMYE